LLAGDLLQKKNKKIAIVGGGITGCVLAMLLSKNNKIEIYESRNSLGGIMEDFRENDDYFYRGCQYFNTENVWTKFMMKNFKNKLYKFDHTYGSFTDFDNVEIYSDKFALPVLTNQSIPNIKLKNLKKNNLKDRYSVHNKKVQNYLNNLIKKYDLNSRELSYNSASGIQLDTITYLDKQSELLKKKIKTNIYNTFFSVDRKLIFKDKLKAILPISSFSKLFLEFEKFLFKKKVILNLKSPIFINNLKDKKFSFRDKYKKLISCDYIIWTGNPTSLVKSVLSKNLDSKKTIIFQYNANIENKKLSNFYVQVFSTKIPITKIYIYKYQQKYKLSVECTSGELNFNNLMILVKKIMKQYKIDLILDQKSINKKKDIRYNIISTNDQKNLIKLSNKIKKTNLIIPDYTKYGRDQRIEDILIKLKEKKLIF
jgi:hypothetical protein